MRVATLTLVLAIVGLAAGSAGAAAATKPPYASGLRGVVMRGPTRPVCLENESCDAPAANVDLQFRRDGVLVARARTGADGGYRVRLRPGVYAVRVGGVQPIARRLTPAEVRVPRGHLARVDFHIDTGIQ
jgi:hypothetical protein